MDLIALVAARPLSKELGSVVQGHWPNSTGYWTEQSGFRVEIRAEHLAAHPASNTGVGKWRDGFFGWSGRLQNLRELRSVVGLSATNSVGDLLRKGLDVEGEQFISRLCGPLVVSLCNERTHQLIWWRDKTGVVPSMFSSSSKLSGHDESVVISTSGDALLSISPCSTAISEHRLVQFLHHQHDASRQDFFSGMSRLRSAEMLRVSYWPQLSWEVQRYWQPRDDSDDHRSLDQWVEHLRSTLRILTREYAAKGKSTAVSMSSGIDSVLLAGFLSECCAFDGPVVTASHVYPSFPRCDESQNIRLIAGSLGTESHLFDLEDEWPLKSLEPFSAFPGYGPLQFPAENTSIAFLKRARETLGTTYLLCGNGADEIFTWRMIFLLRSLLYRQLEGRKVALNEWAAVLRASFSASTIGREILAAVVERLGLLNEFRAIRDRSRYFVQQVSGEHEESSIHPSQWLTLSMNSSSTAADSQQARMPSLITAILQRTDGWNNGEMVARSAWRRSRQAGVELGFPFMDARLVELISQVPFYILFGEKPVRVKGLLREVGDGVIPEHVRHLPKHGGLFDIINFGFVKRQSWLLNQCCDASRLAQKGYLNRRLWKDALERYLRTYGSQTPPEGLPPLWQIWNTLSAELWIRSLQDPSFTT